MKPERLNRILDWWKRTKRKLIASGEAETVRRAEAFAEEQDVIAEDETGESIGIIEVFKSHLEEMERANSSGSAERKRNASDGLRYLAEAFEMLSRGCEDNAIATACLQPEGPVSVALTMWNDVGEDMSQRHPVLRHLVKARRGVEKSAEARHGDTSTRTEKRDRAIEGIKELRKFGLNYTAAAREFGGSDHAGRAIRKFLGPSGRHRTKPD